MKKVLMALLLMAATLVGVGASTAPAQAAPVTLNITGITYYNDYADIAVDSFPAGMDIGETVTISGAEDFNGSPTVIAVGGYTGDSNLFTVASDPNPQFPTAPGGGTVTYDDSTTTIADPVVVGPEETTYADVGDPNQAIGYGKCSGTWESKRYWSQEAQDTINGSYSVFFNRCKNDSGTKYMKVNRFRFRKFAGSNCHPVLQFRIDPSQIKDWNAGVQTMTCSSNNEQTLNFPAPDDLKIWASTSDYCIEPGYQLKLGTPGFPGTYHYTQWYWNLPNICMYVPW